jgi:hypothetical protein
MTGANPVGAQLHILGVNIKICLSEKKPKMLPFSLGYSIFSKNHNELLKVALRALIAIITIC